MVGKPVGPSIVGRSVGVREGAALMGEAVGALLGELVGAFVGTAVGSPVGGIVNPSGVGPTVVG